MAKTQEELNELKQECETLSIKLQELSEDELEEVTGGNDFFTLIPISGAIIGGTQPFIGSAFSQNADKTDKEKKLDNMTKAA